MARKGEADPSSSSSSAEEESSDSSETSEEYEGDQTLNPRDKAKRKQTKTGKGHTRERGSKRRRGVSAFLDVEAQVGDEEEEEEGDEFVDPSEAHDESAEANILPDMRDPKLWMVRVNKEKQ
ncbi:supt5h protein, putative [Eimeria brunetti]|uniref:Supt5h protein, putative n=1 Tax=Eimeria brunetti TaxID=51314 RepID=U6LUQ2_9EIME|nr:supt5h protein, putative [Eimeria brunetti]